MVTFMGGALAILRPHILGVLGDDEGMWSEEMSQGTAAISHQQWEDAYDIISANALIEIAGMLLDHVVHVAWLLLCRSRLALAWRAAMSAMQTSFLNKETQVQLASLSRWMTLMHEEGIGRKNNFYLEV